MGPRSWLTEEKKGIPWFGAQRGAALACMVLTALLIAGIVFEDNEWVGMVMPSLPIWWYLLGYQMGKHDERKKRAAAEETV